MAKKKKEVKTLLPVIIVASAAILALIMALFLPGASKTVVETGVLTTTTTVFEISLKGLMFGSGPIVTTINNNEPISTNYTGGGSTFGIASFILLVLGILVVAASLFVNNKKDDKLGSWVYLIGSSLIALAGILILLLLSGGADVVETVYGSLQNVRPFAEKFEGYSLAIGPILYAVFAILGGGFGIVNYFLKIIK
jgi:hypothetical protein